MADWSSWQSRCLRYRVAHIFDPDLPVSLGLAPLAGGHPELPVSAPERALLELFSETGSTEGLEEVRQLVESTRNLRLPLLDELLGHLTPIKVVRLASPLATELELPCAAGWPWVARVIGWIWPRLHE